MERLILNCSCGDGFVLAVTDREEWRSFERWDANLGMFMNDHADHESLEVEREEIE